MTDRARRPSVDDSEDDVHELELIDLTSEEVPARGPVDVYQTTQNRPSLATTAAQTQRLPQRPDDEIRRHRLTDGTSIHPGDFVELQCPQHRRTDPESSGDFLRILKILKDHQTGHISLRGHRYLREKYLLGKDSDGKGPKLNEVVLHLKVREGDDRPAEVQGLEDIPVTKVVRKQTIVLTDMSYPYKGFRYLPQSFFAPIAGKSKAEQRSHIFKKGPLVCRWSRTSVISPNGTVYGGVYRHVSKGMSAPRPSQQSRPQETLTPQNGAIVTSSKHQRTPSLEEVSLPAMLRRPVLRRQRLTFFDMYCGGGGASRGADQAGLKVLGGLDHDELAIQAWELNNPRSIALCMDSFALLRDDNWRIIGRGRCDILNISNPCQTFSGAHTIKGQNDEINTKQLEVIKPLIDMLKPRVVVLENTAGLANIEKNRPYLNKVLNDIKSAGAGYSLRYKIVNMADYGLPQERKRLLIIAARRDLPLPPFPKPSHGPPGSGLKPYVSIGDALDVIDRMGKRAAERDMYHKPCKQVSREEQLYNPFTKFVDCIMTKGVMSKHWNGEDFTPRQLAALQSLPLHHHLTGSWAQAIKQIGNMFPPLMAELVYRICAQTLEAFDNGFIDADEDIDDLNVTLIEKGIDIPEISHTPTSLFDMTVDHPPSPYRYLSRPVLSDANHVDHSSAWAKRKFAGSDSDGKSRLKRSRSDDDRDEEGADRYTPSPTEPERRHATSVRGNGFWEKYSGKTIELSDSEEEYV